jgi:hypothetical protein
VAPQRNPPRPSLLLLVVLLCSLAVGAAASIVVAARTTPTFAPGPTSELYVSPGIVVLFAALLFGAIVASILYQRVSGANPLPGRTVAVPLVIILGLVLFVVLYRYFGGPLLTANGNGNGTGSKTPPANGTPPPGNNSLGGPGGTFTFLHLPSWFAFAAVAVIAVVAVLAVLPRVTAYLAERREGEGPAGATREAREVLDTARERLAAGDDARGVILELYGALLYRVAPLAGNLDPVTPEEIRSQHLLRLGIRREAADELTRLFEEARYSSHPLDPGAAERALRAIETAEQDLSRSAKPEPAP